MAGCRHVPGEKELFESIFDLCVVIDMTQDEGLGRRIADSLRPHLGKIDGIFTPRDTRLAATAEAADLLGLFTSPLSSIKCALDKYLTKKLEPDMDRVFLIERTDQIDSFVRQFPQSSFPVVVKPCLGDSGQCVAKAANHQSLKDAIKSALEFGGRSRAVLEPYISGPEVDVNFVLLDGEILFGGVCDNFPSQGDTSSEKLLYFAETKNLSPSRLPRTEQDLLVKHLHQTVLRQGFRTGVFHVEGRVENSTVRYKPDEAGLVDLQPLQEPSKEPASVFLHETNARPPGFQAGGAFMLSFGIDFWAAELLTATQDWNRLKTVCVPIPENTRDHLSVENLHCNVSEATVKATFPSLDVADRRMHFMGDPMPELREYNAGLEAQVMQCQVCLNTGEVYGGTGWLWLMTFVVASKKGRREALQMSEYMTRKYRAAVQGLDSGETTQAPAA